MDPLRDASREASPIALHSFGGSNALVALEFPAIAERIAGGRDRARRGARTRARAVGRAAEVARRQALTPRRSRCSTDAAEPPLRGIGDVRARGRARGPRRRAPPGELRGIADTIAGALARARRSTGRRRGAAPARAGRRHRPGLAPLVEAIERGVEPDGSDLKDNASPRLRKPARWSCETGRQRVTEKLRQLARKSGRPRAPPGGLRHPARRPAGARREGELAQQRARHRPRLVRLGPDAVRRAVRRSSSSTTASRRPRVRSARRSSGSCASCRAQSASAPTTLAQLVEATAGSTWRSRSGLSRERWRGTRVEVSGEVRLVGARHPLLDPATAVPIDLELGDLRALVISGPNTGGKTVALKTLGLAALLHQSGLRPPAASAALPVFDEVLADIGDPQSIEMSLSTFSGHVPTSSRSSSPLPSVRSSWSTSSPPAPTRSRARRSRRRCSPGLRSRRG